MVTEYYYWYYRGVLTTAGATMVGEGFDAGYWFTTYSKRIYDEGMNENNRVFDEMWRSEPLNTDRDYGAYLRATHNGSTWYCSDPVETREIPVTEYRYRTHN